MGVLQRFERRLEGLVEGAFARAFGGVVQPVEVAAALQREAQAGKVIVGHGRVLVPNAYVVALAPADAARLEEYGQPLRDELAAMLVEHAAEQGWSFVGPVGVRFTASEEVKPGVVSVTPAVQPADPVSSRGPAPTTGGAPGRPRLVLLSADTRTRTERDGDERSLPLSQPVTVVGRGQEADLQVADTGVSRRHAELRLEDGGVRLVDLQSTNGTRVNGRRVASARLRDGDTVELGVTRLRYRQDG